MPKNRVGHGPPGTPSSYSPVEVYFWASVISHESVSKTIKEYSDLPINFISSIDIMVVTKGEFFCQCQIVCTQISQSFNRVVLI